jgi:hypothetical protein
MDYNKFKQARENVEVKRIEDENQRKKWKEDAIKEQANKFNMDVKKLNIDLRDPDSDGNWILYDGGTHDRCTDTIFPALSYLNKPNGFKYLYNYYGGKCSLKLGLQKKPTDPCTIDINNK